MSLAQQGYVSNLDELTRIKFDAVNGAITEIRSAMDFPLYKVVNEARDTHEGKDELSVNLHLSQQLFVFKQCTTLMTTV